MRVRPLLLPTLVALLVPAAASAAPIAVNTQADTVADDGTCSLREAITAANADTASGASTGECAAGSGADTISLPAGTYTRTRAGDGENLNSTGDLDVSSELTVEGPDAATTTIDADRPRPRAARPGQRRRDVPRRHAHRRARAGRRARGASRRTAGRPPSAGPEGRAARAAAS